ncbi:unnamed protein product, partial [Oppiella nova]
MSGDEWTPVAAEYDPIRVGSIDGTDTTPHDKALVRALTSKHTIDTSIKSDAKKTIFVARLDFNTHEDTIHAHFSKYGSIVSLRLVRDIVTGLSKGYAFVEFKHSKTAQEVYERANNEMIDGRRVLVDHELGRTMHGWKPRRLGGGFGGRKESGQLRFGCRDRPWRRPIRLHKESSDGSSSHWSRSHGRHSTDGHRSHSRRDDRTDSKF